MRARILLVAVCTLAMLAIPGTALAKGASQARLEGPGLATPITISGDGEPGSGGRLAEFATQTGLFPAMFAETPNPMSATRPAGGLGPRYVITYTVPSGTGQDEIRQDLYPFAAGGPLTYTRPGQRFFGTEATLGGWFRGPATLLATLAKLGVPSRAPAPAVNPVADQTKRSGSNPTADAGFPLRRVLLAATGLAALTGAGLGLRIRRRRRA
jgi:hypothetical protein